MDLNEPWWRNECCEICAGLFVVHWWTHKSCWMLKTFQWNWSHTLEEIIWKEGWYLRLTWISDSCWQVWKLGVCRASRAFSKTKHTSTDWTWLNTSETKLLSFLKLAPVFFLFCFDSASACLWCPRLPPCCLDLVAHARFLCSAHVWCPQMIESICAKTKC